MATPLSDEIRALITFANETTEAGDTKLGDCVKTLCEGYNGGKNLPSSPLVVPSGAISSRLAALLAYANETTGAGDTTMGDAIRTLCDGYGQGGELIFYEKLIGDGTAYINTGAPYVEGYTYAARLCIPQTTNSWVMGAWTSNKGLTVTRNGNYVRLRLNTADTTAVSIGSDVVGYHDIDFVFTTQSNISYTLDNTTINTGRNVSNGGSNVFLFGYSSGAAVGTYARNPSSFQSYTVKDESLNEVMHLVPCTYNGEAGMWDLVSQTFFGNAASSGQFTVEGEIGLVEFYDYLQGDGKSYIVTDYTYSDANDVKSFAANFKATNRYSSQTYYLFGAGRRNTSSTNKTYASVSNGRMVVRLNANSSTTIYSEYLAMNTDYRVEVSRDSLIGNLYADNDKDGIYEATIASTAIAAPSTMTLEDKMMYIMTANDGGTLRNIAGTWLYVGEIVIDSESRGKLTYRPCTLNGVAGMLETHDMTFYPAGGSVTAVNRK